MPVCLQPGFVDEIERRLACSAEAVEAGVHGHNADALFAGRCPETEGDLLRPRTRSAQERGKGIVDAADSDCLSAHRWHTVRQSSRRHPCEAPCPRGLPRRPGRPCRAAIEYSDEFGALAAAREKSDRLRYVGLELGARCTCRSSNCDLAKALPVAYTWNTCSRTPSPKAFLLSFAKRPMRCTQIPLALLSTSGSSTGARFEVHVPQRRSGSSIASDLSFATMNR
jgi:hypothetical protein